MIPLGKPKIDSLRIHLPLSEVIVNPEHNSFMRSLTTTNDDGEVLNEHVKTSASKLLNLKSNSRFYKFFFILIAHQNKDLKQIYFS